MRQPTSPLPFFPSLAQDIPRHKPPLSGSAKQSLPPTHPPLRPSGKKQARKRRDLPFPHTHTQKSVAEKNKSPPPPPVLSSPHSSLLRTVPSLSRRGLRKSAPCLPGSPGSFSVLPGASSLQLSAEAAAPISAPSASATVPLQRRRGRPGTTSPPKGAGGPPFPPSPAAGVLLLPASALPAAEPAAPLLLLKIGSSSILPVPLRSSQTFLGWKRGIPPLGSSPPGYVQALSPQSRRDHSRRSSPLFPLLNGSDTEAPLSFLGVIKKPPRLLSLRTGRLL